MLKFNCKNCGQRIRVPEVHAGKKGKCPKCKIVVVVPEKNDDISLKLQNSDTDNLQHVQQTPEPELRLKRDTSPPTRFDGLSADGLNVDNKFLLKHEIKEGPPERKLPWILDIFLYPTSISGVIHLVMLPTCILLLGFLCLTPFCLSRLFALGFYFLLVGYIFYYLSDCIRDSSTGGIRAPDIWNQSITPDRWDCVCQLIRVLVCILVCFGPIPVYFFVAKRADFILVLLLAYGVVSFPMALLSTSLFDSFYALNPILIISSILSTFIQYCGLVILLCIFAGIGAVILVSLRYSLLSTYVFHLAVIYLAMVAAHLLGRFYYRNSKKLNWEV